jgi:hypothetical protein
MTETDMDEARAAAPAPTEQIRLCLDLEGLRLEFRGARTFYERLVEPLVAAAYARAAGGSCPMPSGSAGARVPEGDGAPAAGEGGSAALNDAAPGEPDPDVFHPSTPALFQQFVGQVGPRAGTVDKRIMAFGFYLWNYERQEAFVPSEIEAFFRTVLESPPADLEARFRTLAEGKRFLEEAAVAGAWRLTPKGVNFVKNRLLAASA